MRFDARACSYDTYAAPQRAFAARVAGFIDPSPGEDILELGAGTGALTLHLCGRVAGRVRATDASPAMVRIGQAAVLQAAWSELDAFAHSPPASSLQVSSGLLQWADDPVRVLRHWKMALASGGRMVHAVPCEPCLREWRALVPESPVRWRDEAAWSCVFAKAGLKVGRTQKWVEQLAFASTLELLQALHRSGVTGRPRLGPGRLRTAMRAYDSQHAGPDGVLATWAWLALEAR